MTERASTRRVRDGAGLFALPDRGLLEVRGSDRVRWLDGMLTADVKRLAQRGGGAGCPALLLTHRGAIVADFHVACFEDALLLECAQSALAPGRAALEKRIIADDVVLVDRSDEHAVLGLEGSRAPEILARALDAGAVPEADAWQTVEIAGASVLVAGFGWSGERAFVLRARVAEREEVERALAGAADVLAIGLVRGDAALLEILRVEAGIPAFGTELDEDVLPPEARLERAVAVNKGCYVGQEIVARLRSRGQVNHLLVGLRAEGASAPPVGAALSVAGRTTGEITSAVVSPEAGPIALAFVRREHSEAGTRVDFDGGSALVAPLPFIASASGADPA